MQGFLLLIPAEPRKPRKLIYLSKPPTLQQIRTLIGGTFELVPEFETFKQDGITVRDCTAYCRDTLEAQLDKEAPNQWANTLWGLSLARKYGPARSDPGSTIKGPVLVLTGDEEFLEAL